ncbi:MAG: ABC transporter ATP-binding protein [bacterium]|nr:ABC transporter ATP-binding protein [bacterium]
MEAAVKVTNIVKKFGDFEALSNVSLEIKKGEFFSLLGPSGCGKTTLLRIIAGLEFQDSGDLLISGINATDIPAYKRPVNTVFQSYALFPHLTVANNIAFGLRMKMVSRSEIEARVDRVMDMVQITKLRDREPAQLSGGQQQRVALARAIVNEPEVLLLDEPLGALDLKLRRELQFELMSLQKRLGISFICVTHDQEEALTMSDRIAVMNVGKIEQIGNAEEMYEHPRTKFVSQFLGSANLLQAQIINKGANTARIRTKVGELVMTLGPNAAALKERQHFTVAIRPEKVTLSENDKCVGPNCLPVTVEQLIYIGSETHYILKSGTETLNAEAMNIKSGSQGFDLGHTAHMHIPENGLIVLED